MEIVNLDKLVPDKRAFVLGGKEYVVPGSLSVEKAILLPKLLQDASDPQNTVAIKDVLKMVWDILAEYNKGREFGEFYNAVKIEMLPALMSVLLNQTVPKADDSEGQVDLSKKNSGMSQNKR